MEKITINSELTELLEKLMDENKSEIAEKILKLKIDKEQEKYINHLGKSETVEGNISYLTKDRILKYEESEYWNTKKRYHAKPAKVVETLFPKIYSQREVEIFTEQYRSLLKQDCVDCSGITIVEGEDIKYYYLEDNYCRLIGERDNSSLHSSCMRYESCQDYLDLYAKNINNISLAVLLNTNGKVKARCILWYPKGKNDKSVIYYDRIYGSSWDTHDEMQAMLNKMKFINVSHKNNIKPSKTEKLSIDLDYGRNEFEEFPYVDTFNYIYDKTVYNYQLDGADLMDDTGGGISETEPLPTCDECGHETNDLHYISRGNSRSYNLCEICCTYSDHYREYIANEDSQELASGKIVLKEDAVQDYKGEWIYKNDAVELYNGEWADEDDGYLMESKDNEYFIEGDDNFVEIEGYGWYNIDSSEIEQINEEYYIIGSDSYEEALLEIVEN